MEAQKKRCWVEISLGNIEYNYRQMRERLPAGCRFLGVVKANAYGHGAVEVARTLESAGADYLAVAFIDEAIELRKHGITLPVLILGYTSPEYTAELIEHDITQAVVDIESGYSYAAEAERLGKKLKCHLKLDSGMGRLGFRSEFDAGKIVEMLKLPGLDFEGVFTHFSMSDINGDAYTQVQDNAFVRYVQELESLWCKKWEKV